MTKQELIHLAQFVMNNPEFGLAVCREAKKKFSGNKTRITKLDEMVECLERIKQQNAKATGALLHRGEDGRLYI